MKTASLGAQATASLCALIASTVNAQTGAARLPTAVITPARVVQSLDDALPSTTIITRADIERGQLTDLVGALARQAGVQFAQSGGPGGQASLFLRGANSSQVLVLVDGIPLNAAVGGAATLGGIAVDTIDRIEISRGNLSSLYGSAAIGGVVQIFTRGAGAPGASATIEGGQGRNYAASASATGELGSVRLGGAAATRGVEQISAIDAARVVPGPFAAGANPDLDGNRQWSGSLGARWRGADGTVLAANAWNSVNRTEFDSTTDGPNATHRERSTISAWNARGSTPFTPTWTSALQVGEARDRSRNESSEPLSFNNGEFESRNRQASWSNELTFAQVWKVQVGIEHLRQHGASTSFDPGLSNSLTAFERNVTGVWAGANGAVDRHLLQLNVRHDTYSDVGPATTGLLSYGFRLTPQWRAMAQVSNAFRAPSFSDLYFPFFGNPRLASEKSRSGEMGLHYVDGATTARATLFRTDTRDLIVFDPATQRAENVDRARATGFEISASGRYGRWDWNANATSVRAIDRGTGERLLRRAPYVLNAGVAYDSGGWRCGAELARVGPRNDLDINTFGRTELDAYTLARIVASWRVAPNVSLRARIENVSDARYETVSGYNVPPRTLFAGVAMRL